MKSLPSSNYNLFNKSAKRAIFYRIHDPQKEKEVFSKASAASDTDSCPWGVGTSKTKHSSIILGRYGCATYVFFLLFPSKWANSRWLDLQASWPTWISPWTPSNMWRQAGRIQSSRKLSPGYPSKWINGTETGWWDLSTNWRQNWSRWNNQHLQIEPTQRCSQATKTLSSETPAPAVDKKAVKMLSSQSQELVTLIVGGILFQTTKTTLQADPSSILACIASTCKHGPSGKELWLLLWQKPEALRIHSWLSAKQLQDHPFRASTQCFQSVARPTSRILRNLLEHWKKMIFLNRVRDRELYPIPCESP